MDLMKALFGPSLPSVSAVDVNEKLKNGTRPFLLDVREISEYESFHLRDSVNIPLGELKSRTKELPAEGPICLI